MTFVSAGIFGLGGPEVAALLILLLVGFLVVRVTASPAGNRGRFSRYCPKCGRGLTQQADAPFCGYCGDRLP
jgi:hypothetical protein